MNTNNYNLGYCWQYASLLKLEDNENKLSIGCAFEHKTNTLVHVWCKVRDKEEYIDSTGTYSSIKDLLNNWFNSNDYGEQYLSQSLIYEFDTVEQLEEFMFGIYNVKDTECHETEYGFTNGYFRFWHNHNDKLRIYHLFKLHDYDHSMGNVSYIFDDNIEAKNILKYKEYMEKLLYGVREVHLANYDIYNSSVCQMILIMLKQICKNNINLLLYDKLDDDSYLVTLYK